MPSKVPVQPKDINAYRNIVGNEAVDELLELGRQLKGARVLHLNSTAFGGGVAELLYTMVPLLNSVGVETDWRVIEGDPDFFTITKLFHNALQGMELPWTDVMRKKYLEINVANVGQVDGQYDFVIVHDPQPAAIISSLNGAKRGKWIWRCHIDTTMANPEPWGFLLPYINEYDGAIFTKDDYIKTPLRGPKVAFIPPSIDPLSPKNMIPERKQRRFIVESFNVDPRRPIILQVSRFDPWKDPLGVVDCYRIVKKFFPDAQLVFLASMASDDPEGWHYYEKLSDYANGDPDIYLLSNVQGVGSIEVSAFQAASSVVVQKSLREGFGLTVTEALWKGKPVVAGKTGGITLQIEDGVSGFLVDSIEECAQHIRCIFSNPSMARQIGEAGHEHVRKHFLCTRQLGDHLRLMLSL